MINKYFCIIMATVCVGGMIIFPKSCMNAATEGLILCANVILPSLFPFLVCSKILIKSGVAKSIGTFFEPIMRPLFNVPGCGSFAFILGVLSGYPVGAKCATELYENNMCTKAEAERLICFCNNSGPIFIIGAVGAGMLGSGRAGVYLYLAHLLSAITVGIIMRFYKSTENVRGITGRIVDKKEEEALFSSSVSEGVSLILYISGFVVFFSVLLSIFSHLGITKLISDSPLFEALFYGAFEMVNGVKKTCELSGFYLKSAILSLIMAWGGVSVMLQVFGVTEKHGFSQKVFILSKALQGVIASVYTLLLFNLPMGDVAVVANMDYSITSAVAWAYTLCLMASAVILFLFLSVIVFMVKIVNKL